MVGGVGTPPADLRGHGERSNRAAGSRAELARVFAGRRRGTRGGYMSGSRPIEDYLDKLRRELPGGRRFKRRVLSEVEDHLREGVWHEQEGGVPAMEAERRVIERVGSPRLVARRFAEDLTRGGARTPGRGMLLAMFGVMVLRFLPSPALGELLGMPANGFFEPRGRGRATS